MKKPVFWIASAIVVAGLGTWLWRTVISPPPLIEVSPLSYTDYASWSVVPKETPPAVWKEGWGIDVFLVDSASELKGRSGKQLDKKEQKARLQGRMFEDGLSAIGPVYAPLYRADAKGDDLARAFLIYLRKHNQGRALVIASNTTLPDALLAEIEFEPDLEERFGGFYRLGKDPQSVTLTEGADQPAEAYCPAHLTESGDCIRNVMTVRDSGFSVLAPESDVAASATTFSEWLNANAAPMAEPLGDLEEVEIVDIRRPGDTDERREKRSNRD
ncbi:hypothetical protein [uncultured Hyphomonas sp.]|uniref:hypothetical protein n=1 Tax=uncultured Hyphomonas sp. TaxID=225298 RepID=UPI002AAC1F54|nr:hypothetical protein [uncultured Hyphomonas sp.]